MERRNKTYNKWTCTEKRHTRRGDIHGKKTYTEKGYTQRRTWKRDIQKKHVLRGEIQRKEPCIETFTGRGYIQKEMN